jgi:DNA-directed RNA polymerase subunit RPC12/RpoP
MREYECNECHDRFRYPRREGGIGLLCCPECGSSAIFPVSIDEKPVKRSPKQRGKKKGRQMDLFGKEA